MSSCHVGYSTQIDLHGSIMIYGTIIDIDQYRNIHLKNVTVARPLQTSISLCRLCVRFSTVRYVRIPDDIDVMETIKQDLKRHNPDRTKVIGGGQKKKIKQSDIQNREQLSPLRSNDFYNDIDERV
ncbi:unnamed protein product [Didymodactylos carnosus]|uniref:Sm domain-containing protein n=1 Tax=Didymodactylos carnosus TaxID=1234261 RepID=A0A813NCU8_9BILA|nr:unnamed protein product [Didymodactylos carnosus]CAF0934037.1 unnamed protein product [Didymodactylos carnosus]CAF3514711.1 unnamed protein product [Didymodactylos carnosus]CAF3710001.1 unnamed protein product [Didymodactylos carnosus]